jgi:Leucine-rich repeat (LRR) protein
MNDINGMGALKVLKLERCCLDVFGPRHPLPETLKVLSLEGNRIDRLDLIFNTQIVGDLCCKVSLTELNLSRNQFTLFPYKAIELCKELKKLDLSRN